MRYLYIDNIRGFADTLVPIKDVNFLVGENSTGKTTLMEVMRLLSYPLFWLAQDFYIDESRLNHFQNIVSIHSQDKSYFQIGAIEYPGIWGDKRSREDVNIFLMKFSNKDGMPEISRYNCIRDNFEIKIILSQSRKTIRYKFNPIDQAITDSGILETFKSWISKGAQDDRGYKRIAMPETAFPRRYPIHLMLDFLEKHFFRRKESKDVQTRKISFEIPMPEFVKDIAWLAPIRSEPKRTYDAYKIDFTPEGDHIPYLLRQYLAGKKHPKSEDISLSMESFGKESGLYDSITIKEFGKSPYSPFELDITMGNDSKPLSIKDVGYGVSQCLPVVVELLARAKSAWYAIQQPEVHLHPRAQVALGELIYDMAANEDKHFCVETHSDYMIDRFRLRYGKNRDKNTDLDAQVLYFERTPTGNCISPVKIEENGQYSEKQPETFRDFFINEQLSLLEI